MVLGPGLFALDTPLALRLSLAGQDGALLCGIIDQINLQTKIGVIQVKTSVK